MSKCHLKAKAALKLPVVVLQPGALQDEPIDSDEEN